MAGPVRASPVAARQLPCVFGSALDVLRDAVAETRPDIVIAVGQAGGRSEISLERVAINVDDATIRDNAGAQPVDTPIVADGPAAVFLHLADQGDRARAAAARVPVRVSRRRPARSSATTCSMD